MTTERTARHERTLSALAGLAGALLCIWAIWASGRVAVSRFLVRYGTAAPDVSALDNAIRLTSADAETHYARAVLANYQSQPAAALPELELAVSLRPRDYYLWLELGLTRDELGDSAGALLAFNESVRLAPYYAQPRWQRGNVLFRMGRYDEAFPDLRTAANSNPELLPSLIDLAWGASRYDASLVEQIVQTQSSTGHMALALFFANHGRAANALAHFGLTANVADEKRRELVRALASTGAYSEAFAVWRNSRDAPDGAALGPGTIYDGGFEGKLSFEETTFGWQLGRGQTGLTLSLDPSSPQAGSRSLRVDFNGNSNPEAPMLTQLVLVEPATRYKLNFAVRTKNIVSGGPPIVVIKDATAGAQKLANTSALPANAEVWQFISVDFLTGPATKTILISLQRENCATSPCPIFGSLNVDSFSLARAR